MSSTYYRDEDGQKHYFTRYVEERLEELEALKRISEEYFKPFIKAVSKIYLCRPCCYKNREVLDEIKKLAEKAEKERKDK